MGFDINNLRKYELPEQRARRKGITFFLYYMTFALAFSGLVTLYDKYFEDIKKREEEEKRKINIENRLTLDYEDENIGLYLNNK